MRSSSPSAGKFSIRELVLLPMMGALMFGSKMALASLPNIHLNAVLIILCAVFFGWKGLFSVGIYVMLEGLIFGFGIYWFGYLYVWPLLLLVAVVMRKCRSAVIWAVVAGVYGLVFGPLMYLEYFAINGGWEMFFAMWVSGIYFDLVHCAGNFVLTLVLFHPLYKVMARFLGEPGSDKKSAPEPLPAKTAEPEFPALPAPAPQPSPAASGRKRIVRLAAALSALAIGAVALAAIRRRRLRSS